MMERELFMKKKYILITVSIIIVAVIVFCSIQTHKEIPNNMIVWGQNKVFIAQRGADSYFNDQFGVQAWKYNLNESENVKACDYIEQYPEVWELLDDDAFTFIMYKFRENDKINLLELSDSGVYYCIVDVYQGVFCEARETIGEKYAIYIWDSLQKNYYYIYISGK